LRHEANRRVSLLIAQKSVHGFIAWGDGEVLAEKMASVSQPLPELDEAAARALILDLPATVLDAVQEVLKIKQ